MIRCKGGRGGFQTDGNLGGRAAIVGDRRLERATLTPASPARPLVRSRRGHLSEVRAKPRALALRLAVGDAVLVKDDRFDGALQATDERHRPRRQLQGWPGSVPCP